LEKEDPFLLKEVDFQKTWLGLPYNHLLLGEVAPQKNNLKKLPILNYAHSQLRLTFFEEDFQEWEQGSS
jgi:hypothetical protein